MKMFVHSIIAAAIGGAATAGIAFLDDAKQFNVATHDGLIHLGHVALTGAVIGVLALLKQSPLPAPTNNNQTQDKQ